ncbi:MAG: hypothetical protein ACREBG_19605 [Pyrinomonadaceae bacterium]
MRRKSTTNLAPGLLLLAALLLTSCGMLEKSKTDNSNTATTQTATPATTRGGSSTSTATPTSAPPPSSGPALATADGDLSGVRVEIQELKRASGDTLSLKFAMVNDSDKDLSFGYNFTEPNKGFGDIGGVHLIDAVGKKKYFVVRDAEGACVCSRDMPSVQPKSRSNLWAKFPAPTEDVQKISVVIPHFAPMDDVPIGR